MKFTKKDRLILINQYRILSALDKDDSTRYSELVDILENGYEIFYSLVDEWVEEDMPSDEGKFVLDILDLYRAIEDLKGSGKNSKLRENGHSIFAGFDGNNEGQYLGFCRFLVDKQGKFQEQKQYIKRNDYFNSHVPMVDKYRRMLKKAQALPDQWNMTVDEAIEVLNA